MALGKRSNERALQKVLGRGANVNEANPLEVHDPKVGSLISYEGITTADGAGDGSTLIDSVLTTKPDYNGNLVIITSGTYDGQARDINGATTGGTVTPSSAFSGQILSGTSFVIVGIRATPAEVAAIEAKLDHADHGLAALKTLLDSILEDTETTLEDKLDAIGILIAAIPTTAMRGTDGAALASVLGALNTVAATGAVSNLKKAMAYIKQLVTELIVVDGLVGVIDAATTDSLHGKIGTDDEMADHSLYDLLGALAFKTHSLSAMLGALTATDNLVDILGGYTAAASLKDELEAIASYIDTEVGAIETKLDNPATFKATGFATPTNVTDAHSTTDGKVDDVKTETALIKTETDKIPTLLSFKDQWCAAPVASWALTDSGQDLDAPDVVFPTGFLPSGATVQAIYLMFKWRKQKDSSSAENKISAGSKTIRVMKNGATWGTNDIVAITFALNQLLTDADAVEGGDMIVGDVDVKAEIDDVDNETYNVATHNGDGNNDGLVVTAASLTLYDIYVGMRVYYTV